MRVFMIVVEGRGQSMLEDGALVLGEEEGGRVQFLL